ncbi:response regulator transcription factor [Lederbergia lenta]|uniref:Two-component response regulator of nitrate reduction n=1 Tax=Lederbergia lenta TaxID=1467 RepID=A0A2X4WK10_LEDLE|nr:response regulator transcription factor [Lederbergia lenta]MCM3112160.1 response regulator transcription factor [Lederbergia lenta]MEC2323331.1 response regulator transcription factor [Lederbergia lenta]SQI63229.1 two-component response regulator of nitrate reduction [Lederbergia lenta]
METISILIADDMEAHRRRLERIIGSQGKLSLTASAKSGYEAVAFAAIKKPDIVLMDIEMESQMAGIKAAAEIHKIFPDTKIIMLTVHQDNNIVFAAFQSGIIDYLIKSAPKEEILEAIYSAANNQSPIRPIIAGKIREEFARIKKSEDHLTEFFKIIATLTPSELEVLKLLCSGLKRKEIAKERAVEIDTVKKQVTSLLKKFDRISTKEIVEEVNELKLFDMIKDIS